MNKNFGEKDLLEFKKIKGIKYCTSCSKINYKNKWVGFSKDLFIKIIINNSNIKKLKNQKIKIKDFVKEKNNFRVVFSYKKQDYVVDFPAKATLCKDCSLKKSRAYSGILQIRNLNEEDFTKINDFVTKSVFANKGNVVKIEKLHQGIDYYINPMKTLKKVGYEMIKNFGGFISFNEKLFTRDSLKSKDVYRVNVLVMLPKFKIGDLITDEKDVVLITGHKNRTTGISIIQNKGVVLDDKELKNFKLAELNEAIVVKTHPNIEVLNPKTYESVQIVNEDFLKSKKENIKINDNVLVVFNNEVAYFFDKKKDKKDK